MRCWGPWLPGPISRYQKEAVTLMAAPHLTQDGAEFAYCISGAGVTQNTSGAYRGLGRGGRAPYHSMSLVAGPLLPERGLPRGFHQVQQD